MIKNYIIAGLIALLVTGGLTNWALNMRAQRDAKAEKLTTALAQIETLNKLDVAQKKAIEKLQTEERKNDDKQQTIKAQIKAASTGDNARAAPVLERALDELRKLPRP